MSRNEVGQGLLQTGGSSTIIQNFNNHYATATPRLSLLEALQFSELGYREHTVEAAQDQTCTWLLNTEEYRNWVSSRQSSSTEHRLLWIKAKAGAGKSTLMRFAIKQARQADEDTTSSKESEPTPKRRATAHIRGKRRGAKSIARSRDLILSHFFNARGNALEKSTEGLYRTLLVQLIKRLPHLSAALMRINNSWQPANGQSWPIANLIELLQCAIRRLDDHTVVLFVDALDECNEDEVRAMVGVFTRLIEESVSSQQNFRVCFASRPWPDIKAENAIYINLKDHYAHHQDIKHYIDAQLRIGITFRAKTIRSRLLENSMGVFLWVKLVVAMLNKEYDRGRLENLEKRLQGTHGDLEALYLELLNRNQDAHDESETRIQVLCFQWVLFASGRLKPEELWWGIQLGLGHELNAVRKRSQETDEAAMARYISSASKGLLECVVPMARSDGPPHVQFIHESARQFVVGNAGPLRNAVGQSQRDPMVDGCIQLKECCFRLLKELFCPLTDGAARCFLPVDDPRMDLPLFVHARLFILVYAERLQRAGVGQRQWLAEIQSRNDYFSLFLTLEFPGSLNRQTSLLNALCHKSVTLLRANWTLFLHDARIARKQHELPGLQDGHDIAWFGWLAHSLQKNADDAISCLLDLYMELETRHESLQNLLQELCYVWDANRRLGGSLKQRRFSWSENSKLYTLPGIADVNDELATFILVAATPSNVDFSNADVEEFQGQFPPDFITVSCHILKLGLPNDYFDTAKGCHGDMLEWAERKGHTALAATLCDPSIQARFCTPLRVG